ncbi:hypothetical protein Ddc_21577 [Ditylenchus destructor]|nr:hypothetical protein Ddc_21577 [Ditylenchus destructor]
MAGLALDADQRVAQPRGQVAGPGVGGDVVEGAVVLSLELTEQHAQLVAVGRGALDLQLGEPEIEVAGMRADKGSIEGGELLAFMSCGPEAVEFGSVYADEFIRQRMASFAFPALAAGFFDGPLAVRGEQWTGPRRAGQSPSPSVGEGRVMPREGADGGIRRRFAQDQGEGRRMIGQWREESLFKTARLGEFGDTVEWPGHDDLELAADNLRAWGVEQAGQVSHEFIWRWMYEHDLSLDAAAAALGMSRGMLAYCRSGAKPVPRTVALACLGWAALKKRRSSKPLPIPLAA